jgi:peptidoglycan/xylan/chitin deacetylase (PgdA/CDA1 family)
MTRPSPTSPCSGASLDPVKLLPPLLRQTIRRGRVGAYSVALTFDDGPHPIYTPQILEILRHHRARATFFPLGRNVERYPQLIRQIFAEGHTIGNHSYEHGRLIFVSRKRVRREMVEASAALERITGQRPCFFRPPRGLGGLAALRMASLLGMRTVLWTLSPRDWTCPGVGRIVGRVMAKARDGAIVLLHDAKYDDPGEDRSQTVQALPDIIHGLRARGYCLVTLAELISPRRTEPRGESEE